MPSVRIGWKETGSRKVLGNGKGGEKSDRGSVGGRSTARLNGRGGRVANV